jgi:hypothetical protein
MIARRIIYTKALVFVSGQSFQFVLLVVLFLRSESLREKVASRGSTLFDTPLQYRRLQGKSPYLSFHIFAYLAVIVVASCSSDRPDMALPDSGLGDIPSPHEDASIVSTECSIPLTISEVEAWVKQDSYHSFWAAGGSGDYHFRIEQNVTGALIHEKTGRYLSGPIEGVDIVVVQDDGCPGESSRSRVNVTEHGFALVPKRVDARPMMQWRFETLGGSGQIQYELIQNESGGSVDQEGNYSAGANEGEDIVRVIDLVSRSRAQARVLLSNSASLEAMPRTVFVGVNQPYRWNIVGGSGQFHFKTPVPEVTIENGAFIGSTPGHYEFEIEDDFTGQSVTVALQITDWLRLPPQERVGDHFYSSHESKVKVAGDLNGDGFVDAVFGHPEADVLANNGGAIFVYPGTQEGLSSTVAQTIGGPEREAYFGHDFVLADIDNDGQTDLIVGEAYGDNGRNINAGLVKIYRGLSGGFFEPDPSQTLVGQNSYDYFGWSVAACDFDGDGNIELAVSAYSAEDRSRAAISSNQGGVFIYQGQPTGPGRDLHRVLWGDLPNESGGWMGKQNLHLGQILATGDYDGDGLCDLAVGATDFDRGASNTNDGLVYLFRGLPTFGIRERPSVAWAGISDGDIGSSFGHSLALGDLDGDARDDLIVGQIRHDSGSGDDHGAIRIFRGRDFSETSTPTFQEPETADWSYECENSSSWCGTSVAYGDVTGDGAPDLLSGNIRDQISGAGLTDQGTIFIFEGRGNARLLPAQEVTQVLAGENRYDYLGSAVGVISAKVDGQASTIMGFAALADTYGVDVGLSYELSTDPNVLPHDLQLPGSASGTRFGASADFVGDFNGDGFQDVAVGAPYSTGEVGVRAGAVLLYLGSATGIQTRSPVLLTGFAQHSQWDHFGWEVRKGGDFDGDGLEDILVVSRHEDKRSNTSYSSSNYNLEMGCPDRSSNNAGAVYVFSGTQNLTSINPSFIIYGIQANQTIRTVAGDFDYNGDSFSDIVFGSSDWDQPSRGNAGGIALVHGRAKDSLGRTTVICVPDFTLFGGNAGDGLGSSVAGISDLNRDGCDEIAVGAPNADYGANNQGEVRILYGWDDTGTSCGNEAMMTTIRPGLAGARAGFALSGGYDINRNGLPDLAVGLYTYNSFGYGEGAFMLVHGEYIVGLGREPVQSDTAPTAVFTPLIDDSEAILVEGTRPDGRMGSSIALYGNSTSEGVLVGSPSATQDVPYVGGADLYVYDSISKTLVHTAAINGETQPPGSELGYVLRTCSGGGTSLALVGGPYGNTTGLDTGTVYILDLP